MANPIKPKVVLSEEVVQSIEQIKADDKVIIEGATLRTENTEAANATVSNITDELKRINEMDKESAEYLALKRQRSKK